MLLCDPDRAPVNRIGTLGVGLRADGNHVGIIYRRGGNDPRLWHLAFHFDLRDEPCADCQEKYFWSDSGLDEDNQKVVAAWLTSRTTRSDKIPFGFDPAGGAFDPQTGEFIPPPLGKGFTCATIITAVFQVLGHDLLDEESWAFRVDDVEWQNKICRALEQKGVDQSHIEAVRSDLGALRTRPAEVAAGVLSMDIPLDYWTAAELANQILRELGV
jgi:hypothetical protein